MRVRWCLPAGLCVALCFAALAVCALAVSAPGVAALARAAAGPGAGAGAGAGGACARAPLSGGRTVSLEVGGRLRSALVHVPAGLAAGRRVPLVLVLHGYRGSGPRMERYSGFSALADRYGFVVAYPSSAGSFWNSLAKRRLPDDLRFLSGLISGLGRDLCVDPLRVYAAGVSNGGGMAALAACRLSDRIDALASVAGGYDGQPPCRPGRPVSVLEIHGTADPVVPYFGLGGRPTRDGLPPFVEGWRARDRCQGPPLVRRLAVRTSDLRWTRCASGVAVEHIRIAGGRHQWPGAQPPDPGPPATICASCVIWRFFSALPAGPRLTLKR